MRVYTEKIREISKNLLAEGKVDGVIGYKKGSLPLMNAPCLITTPEATESLVWDSNCRMNLANYLTGRKDKIGIIAKGCDSRNIVTHIIEGKIKRDQLVIIGVPCWGMADKSRLAGLVKEEIVKYGEAAGKITIKSSFEEKTIDKACVLQENCATCIHRNPVIYDELAADLVDEHNENKRCEDVRKIESMPLDEKWRFFEDLLAPCIRCYACRNACPLCYCPTCFVDESGPQWVGKGDNLVDVMTFHFLRAFHCAGRCTDCGACEAACPMDIKVRTLTKKLGKVCLERYGWEAGMIPDARPALDTYNPNDPEEFIK